MRLTTPIWCTEPCWWDGCPDRSDRDGLCENHARRYDEGERPEDEAA
ncbi:hypothetical protein [Nesterenkonia sp. K-15-9-6]